MVLGLWARRELIGQFTRRNIEIRHRGSRLGAFWALLNPLSMLALYFVVFGVIYDQRFHVLPGETRYDFSLALFMGLALFHAFSETLGWAPGVIVSNPNFVKKVVFPLEALPVAHMGATAFHLLVSLGLVLFGSAFGSAGLSASVLWLPVLILPLLLLALGVAWALAAIGVFIRDIGQITAFLSTALLFASAVMYPPAKIQEALHGKPPLVQAGLDLLLHNPLLQLIDVARRVVLWHQPMPFDVLLRLYLLSFAVFALGAVLFAVLRKSFAEVI
jgi:lipopolysaccharide transport system permease protein